MTSRIDIREATDADVGELTRLYQQLGRGTGREPVDEPTVSRAFARARLCPGFRVLLAVENGQVVGTFVLVILETLGARCAPEAVVEDVVVDRDARGRGIGRAMMAFAMEEATRKGCYKIVLSSNLHRREAHAFYESLGFRRHGFSFRVDLDENDFTD